MDLTIVNWIATHLRCPPLDFLMPVITMLGEYGFIWIAVCIFPVSYTHLTLPTT